MMAREGKTLVTFCDRCNRFLSSAGMAFREEGGRSPTTQRTRSQFELSCPPVGSGQSHQKHVLLRSSTKDPDHPDPVEQMSPLAMHPEAETVRAAGPAQACQTPSGLSSHLPSVYDVILSASQGPRLMMQSTMGLFDPSYTTRMVQPPARSPDIVLIAEDIDSLSSSVASAKGLPGCYMTAARDIRSLRVNHQKPRAVGSQSSQGNNARP